MNWVAIFLLIPCAIFCGYGNPSDHLQVFTSLFSGISPDMGEMARNFGHSLASFLIAALIVVLLINTGYAMLNVIRRISFSLMDISSSFFFGFAAISIGLLGLSMSNILFPCVVFGFLIFMAILAARINQYFVVDIYRALSNSYSNIPKRPLFFYVIASLPLAIIVIHPETNIDAMEYDLTVPLQMLYGHSLIKIDMPWKIIGMVELVNSISMIFNNDISARMIRLFAPIIGGAALLRSIGFSSIYSLAIIIISLAIPESHLGLFTVKSDAIVAGAYLCLAAILIMAIKDTRISSPKSTIFIIGLLSGFLFVAKITAVLILLPLLIAWLILRNRRINPGDLISLFPFIMITSPWIISSYIFSGDAYYPIGGFLFPHLLGNNYLNIYFQDTYKAYLGQPRDRSALPMETASALFKNAYIFLICAGIFYRQFWRLIECRYVVVAGLGGILFVFILMRGAIEHNIRYCWPIFSMLNIIGLMTIYKQIMTGQSKPVELGMVTVSGFMFALCSIKMLSADIGILNGPNPVRYFIGQQSSEEYRIQGLGAMGAIIKNISKEENISPIRHSFLTIGCPSWGIRSRLVQDRWLDSPFIWTSLSESDSVRRLEIKMNQEDIRWIMVDPNRAIFQMDSGCTYPWNARMMKLYFEYAKYHLEPLAIIGGFGGVWKSNILFRVEKGHFKPFVIMLPGSECYFHDLFYIETNSLKEMKRVYSKYKAFLPGLIWTDRIFIETLSRKGFSQVAREVMDKMNLEMGKAVL